MQEKGFVVDKQNGGYMHNPIPGKISERVYVGGKIDMVRFSHYKGLSGVEWAKRYVLDLKDLSGFNREFLVARTANVVCVVKG